MINDNDLLLLAAASQDSDAYKVYINSSGYKTLTPQTSNYTAIYKEPYVCTHSSGTVKGLLAGKNPKKVICPNCSRATGYNADDMYYGAFMDAFRECTSLISVSFPSLITATGGYNYGAFFHAFWRCTSLTSVSFPALTTVTDDGSGSGSHGTFSGAFYGCTSLTSISFPALTTATGSYMYGAFTQAFQKCTSLTSVLFPSLITISAKQGNYEATFYKAFENCSPSLKVHFKKSMKGKIGLDYSTMNLKSANQIVFDLP